MPATTPISAEQRILEASFILPTAVWTGPDPLGGEQGGVIGWAALRWYGARWFDGGGSDHQPVPLATRGRSLKRRPTIVACEDRYLGSDFTRRFGIPVAAPLAAAWYAAAHAPGLRAAVEVLDMAAYDGLIDLEAMELYTDGKAAWTGVPQVRDALVLTDSNSWSPQETATRLIWVVDADLPPVLTNRAVFDQGGRLLAVVDLLEPLTGVAIEYDGRHHLDADQRRADIRRHERLIAHGLCPVVVVAEDLDTPELLAQRFRSAYARMRTDPPSRRWTLDAPGMWRPRHPSELRRRGHDVRAS